MTQSEQNKDASPAKTVPKRKNKFVFWLKVVVMFLSGGFIFPHVLSEDVEVAKHDPDKDAKVKEQ
jgi:hypothetical protein